MRSDERNARQIARSQRRKAGDRSARIANGLMKLSADGVGKVVLDEELREVVLRAQAITSLIARRRAERTLAGELRRHDLAELDERLSKVHESGNADTELFHQAEHWRARMLEEGIAAIPEFPGTTDDELTRLLDAARREKTTGKPPGAGKKLFRHIVEALRAPPAEDGDDDETDDETDDPKPAE